MIRVGFVLNGHDWLGGINYFRNLFSALNLLSEKKITPVMLVGSGVPEDVVSNFKDAEIIRSSLLNPTTANGFFRRVVNRLSKGRDPLLRQLLIRHKIDVLSHFPAQWSGGTIKKIAWIPDFQHVYLPEFFSPGELAQRTYSFRRTAQACDCVVLSSKSAQEDLARFDATVAHKSVVLSFVPEVDANMQLPSLSSLEKKYDFKGAYFYIPNQFWIHKNHKIVVEALATLKSQGVDATVLLTGNTQDYRHPDHYANLMGKVTEHGLTNSFRVLGTVPYGDLIALMHYSVAIINPSLFEGWSSTVEEAKALSKSIILSSLPVHIEQNPKKGIFFDPANPSELADKIQSMLSEPAGLRPPEARLVLDVDYLSNRLAFAQKYQNIVEQVIQL